MKKLMLLLAATILIATTTFSQSFIGYTKTEILKSVESYNTSYSFKDNVLTVSYLDSRHEAVYAFTETDLCAYYMLFYRADADLSELKATLTNKFYKLEGSNLWYQPYDIHYVYYRLDIVKNGVQVFSVYFDSYQNDILEVLEALQ